MPSILDYLDHPEFLQSVIGGNTADSFGPQPQQPPAPPPPPPDIMAQAPPQFGPGGAVDGGTSPTDSFSARFSPGSEPISMPTPMPRPRPVPMPQPRPPNFGPTFADRAAPAQAAIESGDFDPQGRNYTDFGLGPSPGSAMAFAGAPQTRNGFPYEAPPGVQSPEDPPAMNATRGEISVNRTPRNGMSLDDMEMNRPTPAGNPMDIRSPAQRGAPDPRIARARAFGNFMASLGHGLTAVGNQKPGTSGAAAFAGGAGGALTGGVENEKHNLDRDEKGFDRAERGRERDQTFDYQNRTLRANTDYHDKMVEQHKLDRDERAGRERWTPVGRDESGQIIYADRNSGEERVGNFKGSPLNSQERWTPVGRNEAGQIIYADRSTGQERTGTTKGLPLNPRAEGAGGNTERLAKLLVEDATKRGEKLTLSDAVKLTQNSGNDRAYTARMEGIAKSAWEAQERAGGRGPKLTLDQWRQRYGLAPFPPLGPVPGTQSGPSVDPDRMRREGPKFNGRTEGQITPAPTLNPPALPGQGTAPPGTLSRPPLPGPTPTPPPNPQLLPPSATVGGPSAGPAGPPAMNATRSQIGPTPPRPPQVPPGSSYSPSRNAWRAPDGTIIPGQPPQ